MNIFLYLERKINEEISEKVGRFKKVRVWCTSVVDKDL
jgi:hypothetical protein